MTTPEPAALVTSRPLTGAVLFTGLGAVLLVMALSGFLLYDANLVGSGPENTAAQNVMLCLGLFAFSGSLASFVVAAVLRLRRR